MKPISHKKSDEILKRINPPLGANSLSEMNSIVNGSEHLTLIEAPFFKNIQPVVKKICESGVEGDVVMVGVFKGGSALYLKALFEEYGCYKNWWLFDSFKGFNEESIKHEQDIKSLNLFTTQVKVQYPTAESVYDLFKGYSLDNNLRVVEGFVEDTLPGIELAKLSFLHIDVDFYEPTFYCLENLYPRLTPNGWVIIDDYNVDIFNCKEAVADYRKKSVLQEPIVHLGGYPAGWEKSAFNTSNRILL